MFQKITILILTFFTSLVTAQTVNIEGNPYGGNPYASINDAINASNDGDVILITGVHTALLTIQKSITLRGTNPNDDIIQAATSAATDGTGTRVIYLSRPNTEKLQISIENLGIRHGNADSNSNGGGIEADKITGLLTLKNLIIENNHTNRNGGALSFAGSNVEIIDCTIRNNDATLDGGAIIAAPNNAAGIDNIVTFRQSVIHNNTGRNGGAIYINGNTGFGNDFKIEVNFENSTVANNAAFSPSTGLGGGSIFASSAFWTFDGTSSNISLKLVHATFYNNTHAAANKAGIQFAGSGSTNFSAYNSIIVAANAISVRAINFVGANTTNVVNCILGGLNAAPTALLDDASRNNLRGRTATFAGISGSLTNEGGNTEVYALNSGSTSINFCTASTGQTIPAHDQRDYSRVGTQDAGSFEVTGIGAVVWNGTSWSNTVGPDATLNAMIDADYQSAINGGSISARKLTISATGSLTINSGDVLTTEDIITNNSTANDFVIESGAYVIQNQNVKNAGIATIKRTTSIKRLDISLWSSPVAAQILLDFSPATLVNRFFNFNETSNNWTIVTDPSQEKMLRGMGYGVRAPNNWPTTTTPFSGDFKGVLNNGAYSQSFTSNHATANFNLIGNPYPSVLDLRAFYTENNTKIQNTFYFYEHSVAPGAVGQTNYGTLTIAPNPFDNVYIPASNSNNIDQLETIQNAEAAEVGQGFFVRSIAGQSGVLNFDNAMRKTSAGVFFKTVQNEMTESSKFRLQITNPEGYRNQTFVGYYEYADNSYDLMDAIGFDAPLYTILENKKLVSQGFGCPFEPNQVIALGGNFEVAGAYTIEITNTFGIFENEQQIIIHDTELQIYHNLSLSPYQFEAFGGENNTRFKILFTSVLSQNNPELSNNSILVYEKDDMLHIKNQSEVAMKSISITDLSGKSILEMSDLNSNHIEMKELNKKNTLLIVRVTTENGTTGNFKIIY